MAKTGNNKQMSESVKEEIVALSKQKMSTRKIAAIVGFSSSSVSELLQKFARTGSLERKKGSGRVKKTTEAEDRIIKRIHLRDSSKSSSDIKQELMDVYGVEIDSSTVRRRLIKSGIVDRHNAKKTSSKKEVRQKGLRRVKQPGNCKKTGSSKKGKK